MAKQHYPAHAAKRIIQVQFFDGKKLLRTTRASKADNAISRASINLGRYGADKAQVVNLKTGKNVARLRMRWVDDHRFGGHQTVVIDWGK